MRSSSDYETYVLGEEGKFKNVLGSKDVKTAAGSLFNIQVQRNASLSSTVHFLSDTVPLREEC